MRKINKEIYDNEKKRLFEIFTIDEFALADEAESCGATNLELNVNHPHDTASSTSIV